MMLMTGLSFFLMAAAVEGEPVGGASQVELQLGHAVAGRRLDGGGQSFFAGQKAIAWTAVSGIGQGFVEHVWYRNGQEVARHYLPVGSDRRWRTWSRHTVGAGEYTVEVLGPDGKLLARRTFTVEPEPLGC